MPEIIFNDQEWLAGFILRMVALMKEEGIKDQNEFNEKIGIQRALTRWKTRETTPSLKSFLAIKKAFNRSLDWIIFGKETVQPLQEINPVARSLTREEVQLLNEVMIMVEEVLEEEKKQLRVEQKSRILTRIYNDCAEDQIKPDRVMVKRYLSILD